MTVQSARRSRIVVLTALLVGVVVWADEPKVEVVAEVVQATDAGSAVEPPSLAQMKAAFEKSGIHYKSYRRLSRDKLVLRKGQPVHVTLPDERQATLRLKSVQNGSAQIEAQLPPLNTTYTLGREGSVFMQAGPHNGGVLILVLSPAQP